MVQYSRTVAIRDAQVHEKELVSRKKLLEEKREGILMEIARIKQVSGAIVPVCARVDVIPSRSRRPRMRVYILA